MNRFPASNFTFIKMNSKIFLIAFACLIGLQPFLFGQEKISFPSVDGLEITADWYKAEPEAQIIVLCHQAGWSRGEYIETALWLNSLGYACLAIDQRSGEGVNDVQNETAARAKAAGKAQTYLDAEQDICAAVEFAYDKQDQKVILVGSSYSASLVLKVAAERREVLAVAAFSPGEYFGEKMHLGDKIAELNLPTFITCAPNEIKNTRELAEEMLDVEPTFFEPKTNGEHGSRALWTSKKGHEAYRNAFQAWLESI